MLDIYPSPMNINLLKKVPSNANINVWIFHHDIVEYNSGKSGIYCPLNIPSIHQEPKQMRINEDSNINIGNIPCNYFSCISVVLLGFQYLMLAITSTFIQFNLQFIWIPHSNISLGGISCWWMKIEILMKTG